MYLSAKQKAIVPIIIKFWIATGFTFAQACAWVAMAIGESSLNPLERGDRDRQGIPHAFGLYQDQDARCAAILAATGVDMKNPATSVEDQLRGVAWEISPAGPEHRVTALLKPALTPAFAARVLVLEFERPADKAGAIAKRTPYADAIAAQFKELDVL